MQKAIYIGAYLSCLSGIYSTIAMTALHQAVFHKDLPKLKELIANNEIEYIDAASYLTAPPLILAAQNGDTKIINMLIQAGAQVETCDRSGRTALHWAVSMERIPVIYALLLAGADIYAKNGKISAFDEAKTDQIHTILLSRPEARQEIEIFCQTIHKHLGIESPAQNTPEPAFDLIFRYLRLKPNQNP